MQLAQSSTLRQNVAVRVQKKGTSLVLVLKNDDKIHKLTPHAWLRIAFDFPHVSRTVVAAIFGVSRRTVQAASMCMASMLARAQMSMLEKAP